MKIYTAATFSEQKRIRAYKERLIQLGHSVLSSWLEEQVKPDGMTEEQFFRKMAIKDLQEIAAADCLILDTDVRGLTQGKMVEFGFALARHKLLFVVGSYPKNSIFLLLADRWFASWEDIFTYFLEIQEH